VCFLHIPFSDTEYQRQHVHKRRYYKNNGEASDPRQCQAAVDLFLCGPLTDARGKFFSVEVSGKEINLKAKSEAEASQWVESLRKIQGV
jgi:hypothetical protein